jgi:hypothetical protein
VVFLNGTYTRALIMLRRGDASGVTTLRAQNPILDGIDFAGGSVGGLRSAGAVFAGSHDRALEIRGVNGIVVQGLKFTGTTKGLMLVSVTNADVRQNHFHENSGFGLVVTGGSNNVRASGNYFTNTRTEGSGAYMDYGIFADHPGSLAADNNLVDGRFNQAMSIKSVLTSASFTRNMFRCRGGGSCLMLGQCSDVLVDGRLQEHTTVQATVAGNRFESVAQVLQTKYDLSGGTEATGGRLPKTIAFTDNDLYNTTWFLLSGRGTVGETVTISGNRMLAPLRGACRVAKMLTAGGVVGEQTSGYPAVSLSNNAGGLACSFGSW